MNVYTCIVCNQNFTTKEDIYSHFRNKRKNKEHATYINKYVKESFYYDNPFDFLKTKFIKFSKQSLNEKWKRWYDGFERRERGTRLTSKKNRGKKLSKEVRQKVSEGLKRAYKEGRKKSPMKGKVAHNKGVPCSEEQKKQISLTLRRKYASGELKVIPHGNDFHYGYREGISHFCRSSWEANIARFLIFYDIEYEYEKSTFILKSDIGELTYIPDFYLKEINAFLEVKGRYETISKLKHKLFREQYPQFNFSVLERREYFKIERRLCRKIPNWELSRRNIDLEKYLIKD